MKESNDLRIYNFYISIIRIEQLYPLPLKEIKETFEECDNQNTKLLWIQEEPENCGAWIFIKYNLEKILKELNFPNIALLSRPESCSVATGSYNYHLEEEKQFIAKLENFLKK